MLFRSMMVLYLGCSVFISLVAFNMFVLAVVMKPLDLDTFKNSLLFIVKSP